MANEIKIKLTIDGKEAVATLDLSDQKLQKLISTSKTAQTSTDGLSGSFNRLAATLIGFFAVDKIIGLTRDSVNQFAEEERTIALLKNTVGGATKGLVEYADQMARITGIKDDEIMSAEKQIGDFVKDEDMIKRLTKATIDFAVAKRIDLASASNLVSRLLAGESSSLGRIKLDIEANARGTDRYNQVVDAMTKIWGGQAETAGNTFSGTLGKMRNSVDNLKEAIGSRLAPVITIIADKIGNIADKAQQSNKALMSVEIIARTLGIIFAGLSQIIVTVGTVLGGLFGMIGKIAYELPSIIQGMAQAASGNPIGAMIAGNSVDSIIASFDKFKSTIGDVQKAYADFYNLMLHPQSTQLPDWLLTGGGKEPPPSAGSKGNEKKYFETTEQLKEEIKLLKQKAAATKDLAEQILYLQLAEAKEKELKFRAGIGRTPVTAEANMGNPIGYRGGDHAKGNSLIKLIDDDEIKNAKERVDQFNNGLISETVRADEAWHNLGMTMSRSLTSAIMQGKKLTDVLSDMLGMFLEMGLQATMMGLFSMLLPGGSFLKGFGKMFGFANEGVLYEPVVGVGMRSGNPYSFAEFGPEAFMKPGKLGNYNAAPQRLLVEFAGEVGVGQRGIDLHGTMNKRNIILKKYY